MKYPDPFTPFSLGRTIQTNPGRNLDSRSTTDRSRCEGGQIGVLAPAGLLLDVILTGHLFGSGCSWSHAGADALGASRGSRGIAEDPLDHAIIHREFSAARRKLRNSSEIKESGDAEGTEETSSVQDRTDRRT